MLPAHVPGIFSVTVSILMGFRPSTLIRCVSTFDQNAQRISVAEGLSASKCIVTIHLQTFRLRVRMRTFTTDCLSFLPLVYSSTQQLL